MVLVDDGDGGSGGIGFGDGVDGGAVCFDGAV